jgi:CelD/BcsL family acetyltransferase involved in cellulose biosynthesis
MATAIELRPESRPATTTTIDFRIASSAAELQKMDASWEALDRQVASPMQTFAWIEACAETFGQEHGTEIVIGCRNNEVVAVAPLFVRSRTWSGRRELLNYDRLYEPADLAFRDTESLVALACAVRDRRRPLLLERLFAASPTIVAVQRCLRHTGRLMIRPQAATPWIALDESWAVPEEKLSSRRRSDFRRSRRQAEQAGTVRAESHIPQPQEVDSLLDVAYDVERRSWKGDTGTALADSPSGDFYRRYARNTARTGQFRIELLYIGQQVAAMQLAVVHQNRYWVLKVGYDPQFQRASPGILLMVEAIKSAVVQRLTTYELLGTVEPWIQVWTELERACVSLRYYPTNWRGAAALAGDLIGKARCWLKRK